MSSLIDRGKGFISSGLSVIESAVESLPTNPISNQPSSNDNNEKDQKEGLDFLKGESHLFVYQKPEYFFEKRNVYEIKNSKNELIYTCVEVKEDFWTSFFKGKLINLIIKDKNDKEIINLHRDPGCCEWIMEVESPPGILIGKIRRNFIKEYKVYNLTGSLVYKISAEEYCLGFCQSTTYDIRDPFTGDQLGSISNEWAGWKKELLTDADNYGIHFPQNADEKMKAILLGALILIDILQHEATDDA